MTTLVSIVTTTSSFDIEANDVLRALTTGRAKVTPNPYARRLSEAEVSDFLQDTGAMGMIAGVEPLTASVLDANPQLRVISRCGAGLDSVDLGAARERGVSVYSTPDAPARAVAEFTIGLILCLLRRIAEADRSAREGRWEALRGGLLGARTAGVVGYGRIGRRVARLLQAFGARVTAADPHVTQAEVELLPLQELLKSADVVSLHLPYSHATHHLLDAEALALMRPNAILVNTARGGIIDEGALARALEQKRLAGAALDCFSSEPYEGPLRLLPNVVTTAHMGSSAIEARRLMEAEAAQNLLEGLKRAGLWT